MFESNDCFEPCADRAAGDVIDGEAIIINLETGVYYSMQGTGGRIWSMIHARRTAGSMIDEIVTSYEVTRDVAATDLFDVLSRLSNEGLIRRCEAASEVVATAPAQKEPYTAPSLEVYRDMQDLLALDPPAPGMNQIVWSNDGSKR